MKTAREVIDYCFSHGRIIDYDRRKIAIEDILAKDGLIQQQAKQIEHLEKLNMAFSHELRTFTELNTNLQAENQRLKELVADLDDALSLAHTELTEEPDWPDTEHQHFVSETIEQALAAQPQKGQENE